ncbi:MULTISPECIES: DUF6880 family protein [Alcanivoracaceae]|uniref:DUF6880 family protein n=1 Tax=Alcanivoracaceae TaxID=224372 RepID=UPI00351007CD
MLVSSELVTAMSMSASSAPACRRTVALAGRIKVFDPLLEHHAFVQQLQSAHGRKSSFWARL